MQLQPGRLNQSMLCMNIIDTTCACLRLHSAFGCANTNYIHIHTFIHYWSPSMCMCTMYVCTSLSGLCGPVHVKHPLCSRLYRCMWCDVHVYWIQFTANVMSTSRIWFFFSFFFFIFFSFCCARSYANCWDSVCCTFGAWLLAFFFFAKAIFAHKIHAQHRHHISSVGVAILHKSSGGECERKIHTHNTHTL